jgi:hypothetical protein
MVSERWRPLPRMRMSAIPRQARICERGYEEWRFPDRPNATVVDNDNLGGGKLVREFARCVGLNSRD